MSTLKDRTTTFGYKQQATWKQATEATEGFALSTIELAGIRSHTIRLPRECV